MYKKKRMGYKHPTGVIYLEDTVILFPCRTGLSSLSHSTFFLLMPLTGQLMTMDVPGKMVASAPTTRRTLKNQQWMTVIYSYIAFFTSSMDTTLVV